MKALEPLYKRLQKYSNGQYTSTNTAKAVISFGDRDIDHLRLPIYIKYNGKKYSFDYKFGSVEEFRTMYETRGSFKAIPLFGAEAKGSSHAQSYLTGFNVVHLGNNRTQFFKIDADYNIFPEIVEYEKMLEVLNPKPKEEPVKKSEIKRHTSDTYSRGFDIDSYMVDIDAQLHFKFGDWFGIYFNGGFFTGFYDLGYNKKSDYYDYYGSSSSSTSTESSDFILHAGMGIDLYFNDISMMFVEANAGYVWSSDYFNRFVLLAKAGIGLHSIGNTKMRLNLFIEHTFLDLVKKQVPFFGVGFQF